MIEVELDDGGTFARAARKVRSIGDHAVDARPAMRDVIRILLEANTEWWTAAPWPGLDPDTRKRKTREGKDPRVMRVTSTLQHALTVWGAPGQLLDVQRDEAKLGIESRGVAYYGRFHHIGQSNPRRPLFNLSERTKLRMTNAVRDYLIRGFE